MEALFPLIITFGLMWVLLIRPQQRRVRQHQSVVASLVEGDEVVTTGGLIGTVEEINEDVLTVSVAPGVSIKMLRSAVQNRIGGPDDPLDELEPDEEPELPEIEPTAVDELPAGASGALPPAGDPVPTDAVQATGDTPSAPTNPASPSGGAAGDEVPPRRSDAGNDA